MYRAFGLLQPTSDFTLESAQQRLAAAFPGYTVARTGEQIVVSQGEWWIAMTIDSGDQVQGEIIGLVGNLAGVEQTEADALIASGKRVEVWTDVPDPFMEHFNDYLSVVEVLKSFNGLLAVDPNEPGVL